MKDLGMWDDIIHDTLFIGQTTDDLNEEVRTNTWLISMSREDMQNTSKAELLNFFSAVTENRKEQIHRSHRSHGMWFYVWHDQQASQLRFSLISDFHTQLPFEAKIIPEKLETIIEEFLYASDHIPFSRLKIEDYDAAEQKPEDEPSTFVLPVFKIQLL